MIGMTVCSGIGAPECAAPWIDWRYQSEIEKFPCAVLKTRFPHAVNLGDMTKFKDWPDAVIDVLCGGTPCQSFSVAGLRKGLDDPRGNLMLTYLAIAERYQPRWIVWENVPGVLSSNNGRDFGTFLGALGQLGYGFAYRVLDAQYIRTRTHPRAVPQRRRRVFVVGYLGDWRRAAQVLLDPESLRGNPAPGRKAGQGTARGFETGPHGGGVADVARSLLGKPNSAMADDLETYIPTQPAVSSTGEVAHCLNAGGMGRIDYETETMIAQPVAPTLRAGGNQTGGDRPYGTDVDTADSLVPIAFGAQNSHHQGDSVSEGFSPTLDKSKIVAVASAFGVGEADGVAHCLRSGASKADKHESTTYIAQPWAVRRLTPLECERLQAFPVGWTDVEYRGKRAADGPRYKALGNSMAVNVMNLIFERIRVAA